MSILQKVNNRANIRKTSNADLPYDASQPVINRYETTSIYNQTVINLNFSVDQSYKDCFALYVDGSLLREGASNDYTFTSISSTNTSSQVTLNYGLSENLNIIAIKFGTMKQSEFISDNRFTQLYDYQGNAFQGYTDVTTNLLTPTTTIGTPVAGTFYSTLSNRPSIPDFTKDLKPRFGVERVEIDQIYQIQNEFGPNGELIWGATNDPFNLVRFVGNGWFMLNDTYASRPQTATQNDYIEIVFYGTGFNILTEFATGYTNDWEVSIDGGSEINVYNSFYSNILKDRNTQSNQQIQIATNLTLGTHTAKIRNNGTGTNYLLINGYEVINRNTTATNISIAEGTSYIKGQKLVNGGNNLFNYNEVVTGTTGARVLVYQKSDGTIGKSWQAVDSAPKGLSFTGTNQNGTWSGVVANHANEEIARIYNIREFGAGLSTDYSYLSTQSDNRVHTLSDGTTTLLSTNSMIFNEGIYSNSLSGFVQFTFVGTGLDICTPASAGVVTANYSIVVDGATIATNQTGYVPNKKYSIVSGLPYGTHVVKFLATGGSSSAYLVIKNFVVYQPKKPTLLSGAIEIADYNVMANYAVTNTNSFDAISVGVLRKPAIKEFLYKSGSTGSTDWTLTSVSPTGAYGGYQAYTNKRGMSFTFYFYGTGFNLKSTSDTNRSTVLTVDITNQAGYYFGYSSYTKSTYGSFTFLQNYQIPVPPYTIYSNVLNENGTANNPSGLNISDLPLDYYTVTITQPTSTAYFTVDCVDIITPTHSYKSNLYIDQQNTLTIGSNNISDNRKFTAVKELSSQNKSLTYAAGITSGPSTNSQTYYPVPEMNCTIKTGNSLLQINFASSIQSGGVASAFFAIFVDGVQLTQPECQVQLPSSSNNVLPITMSTTIPVSAGVHNIEICWKTASSGNTIYAYGTYRTLTVREI